MPAAPTRDAANPREEGASMAETALLVALIAMVALASIELLGGEVAKQFQSLADAISGTTHDIPTGILGK